MNLRAPFPLEDSLVRKFTISSGIGFIIFLFLIFFKPFDLGQNERPVSFAGWIAIIGVGISLFHMLAIQSFFNASKWNIAKEICWNMWIIFVIGAGVFHFYTFRLNLEFELSLFFKIESWVFATTLVPVCIIILFQQNLFLKQSLLQSQKINQDLINAEKVKEESENVTIQAENPKNNEIIDVQKILFIESAGNYIVIYLEDEPHKIMIRTTIKSAQSDLSSFPHFYRAQKGFIVNLKKVVSVTGNAQGLKIKLGKIDKEIPVSRRLTKKFSEVIARIQ